MQGRSRLRWHAGVGLRLGIVFYAILLAIVGGLLALIADWFHLLLLVKIAFFWIVACIAAVSGAMLFLHK